MIDQEKLIKILEREFREKRIYGDSEDFKLFKQEKDENNQNCNILINEYYSHGGFPYQNNKEAEEHKFYILNLDIILNLRNKIRSVGNVIRSRF
ncbi:MAG: hypothetical protein P8Y97_24185 [Candidatus Lokiarchaeota archaeon]